MRADLPGKERLRIVSKTGTVALPQLIAFGLLAAIVIIAILVPAGAAAGVSTYLIGYVLGLGNRTIGLLALAAWVPFAVFAIWWIWPQLKPYAPPADGGTAQ
jgi:hypothetical protein